MNDTLFVLFLFYSYSICMPHLIGPRICVANGNKLSILIDLAVDPLELIIMYEYHMLTI